MRSKERLVELIVEAKSLNRNDSRLSFLRNEIEKDLDCLEKLEKVIEILKRICLFEFEEETINQQDEWDDCYVIYVTQFNNGFNKEEYELLKEVFKNEWMEWHNKKEN